ncbi:MAG: glycosyltransferase family 4 protein [Candidatus Thiodiazotropha taylori]|nr:glycosyltransferase family 4 protein [Candidatus Thiodiazotropha taylori]MCW4227078.1 glycosyltransferase family 4 protein [Candidatus Thiodiazotropha endolucinida]MCG7882170.1 glycosyltransferase family 4 protein [Candidatus Thiodiazotropha taylori]MCG7888636.1 glycosyltransferase family 4 protein [Candidatus Thiodiazotropha taylori]MCG7953713.1 glycosyltransferase family 4 protein [Candidatus Thiodiazotropha taylori]
MPEKILQILDLRDSPWVDGPGRTILQCADMIDRNKCNIHIGAFSGESHNDHAYMKKAVELGLDVVAIKENRSFDRSVIDQIKQVVRKRAIDIIHTHDFRSNIYGLICARSQRLPLVSTCHGWISNNWKGRLYTAIDKYLLRFHDQIIVVSDVMKKRLERSGIQSDKIHVINNALVINDYEIKRENSKFRNELNISKDKKIIASIGRLSPEKRQDIFLSAAKYLVGKNRDLIFLIVGVGPEEDELRALANELGISDNVIFSGYRNDMVDIYNGIDLVVQSSNTEGMPNVVLESLLMGVPVIATNVGGTAQIVQHNVNGVLIESEDLSALEYALEEYINNVAKHNEMALVGRNHVIENFNQDARVKKLFSVYERLAEENNK